VEPEPSGNHYSYNYECPGNSCAGEGEDEEGLFGEREVERSSTSTGLHLDPQERCRHAVRRRAPLRAAAHVEQRPEPVLAAAPDGPDHGPDAQAAGFCVDVNAITRTGDLFGGDLRIPVLFVEDLKLRP